jgi:L-lactate dehydrogenase complex protein LldE
MLTVQLFVTCLIDTLQPQIGEAVVKVLNRVGIRVEFLLEQTCCGQPAFNAGMRKETRKTAEHTIEVFESTSESIIIPSGSCTAMIRHGYPELFEDDSDWLIRAKNLADRTYEFTEFLVDKLGISEIGASYPGKITYHPSCHLLRILDIDHQPRILLNNVREAEIIDLPHQEECCGFGGIFSLKYPEISAEILNRKIENIKETSAATVVVCDTGCLMHIQGGLHRQGESHKVLHIAELLARNL